MSFSKTLPKRHEKLLQVQARNLQYMACLFKYSHTLSKKLKLFRLSSLEFKTHVYYNGRSIKTDIFYKYLAIAIFLGIEKLVNWQSLSFIDRIVAAKQNIAQYQSQEDEGTL